MRPAAVELAVEDLLPRTEIEPALGDRDDHLVVDEQVLEVGVAVVLAAAVVAVIAGVGQQLARDLVAGSCQLGGASLSSHSSASAWMPGLVVVDPDAGGDVHRAHERHALGDSGLADRLRDIVGDPDELAAPLGVESPVDGVRDH